MCGRYVFIDGQRVFTTWGTVLKYVIAGEEVFRDLPRYNAAPMDMMPVVAMRDGKLAIQRMRWWLVPYWSKDGEPVVIEKEGKRQFIRTFNAKAETLDSSKLFAPFFKGSRCLIPADAFYEWKQVAMTKEVNGKPKQVIEKHPYCIRMKNRKPFMFAGLFSVWKSERGDELPNFTIITTEPNELMASIHNRMPVILPEEHFEKWLDRNNKEIDELKKLLLPYPESEMEAFRVSSYVSNSKNEGEECLRPV